MAMNKPSSLSGSRVLISFVLGFTSLFVFFVAGSAFEVKGENSVREIVAACLFGSTYLAFCQFWVAPTGVRGIRGKWPTLVAMVAPLFLVLPFIERGAILGTGIPLVAIGCLGSLVGAVFADRVAIAHRLDPPPTGKVNRLENCRRCLKTAVSLLAVLVVLVALGVIPPLLADSTPGFNARSVAVALGVAVVLNLLAMAVLAFGALRHGALDSPQRVTLGFPAFLSFLLALVYAFASGIGSQSPSLRTASVLLMLSATVALVTTALVTITAIFAERASLAET
jgi:hypothetical protein